VPKAIFLYLKNTSILIVFSKSKMYVVCTLGGCGGGGGGCRVSQQFLIGNLI